MAGMKSTSSDLTKGNITRLLISFSLPILLGQIFQNLYNSVDAIVVGNYVGTTALAAVSASSDVSLLMTGFFSGLSAGAGVLFSRYFGAKNYEKLHDAIHTALLFSLMLGAVMAVLGIWLTPALLRLMDCPEQVMAEAVRYMRIYLIGLLLTAIYNTGSGVLRAVGDSRTPFYYLVLASAINIALDVALVTIIGMGVEGVAVATIVSQFISVILVFRKLMLTHDVYRVELRALKLDKAILKDVVNLGLPAAIQSSLTAIGNFFLTRYINSFGAAAMAGIGAAKKVDKFISIIGASIGLATTTFVSQNLGANRPERSFGAIRRALTLCLVTWLVMALPLMLAPAFFIRLFTQDSEAISYGVNMMQVMVPLYFCLSVNQVYANAVRGFGYSRAVMLLSLLGMVGVRQLFLIISMSISYSVINVYFAYPVGWVFAGIPVFIFYLVVIRGKKEYSFRAIRELEKAAAGNE